MLKLPEKFLRQIYSVACVFLCSATWAQDYPPKPATLAVHFAPGSLTDATARVFAKELSKTLGQTFIVENRLGLVGMRLIKAAPPNGLTLLWHSSAASS